MAIKISTQFKILITLLLCNMQQSAKCNREQLYSNVNKIVNDLFVLIRFISPDNRFTL